MSPWYAKYKAQILVLFSLSMIFSLSACERKERLTASSFSLTVTPPAASVVNGESMTFVATGESPAGQVEVNPVWTISGGSASDLSTQLGPTVIYSPSALGDVELTAVFDGMSFTAEIAVVTYIPSNSTFDVYSDLGLPSGSGLSSDIFVSTNGYLSLSELSTGYTPEGIKFQRGEVDGSPAKIPFWGVTLDSNETGANADLSGFSSGHLKFSLRWLNRGLVVGEVIRIEITDKNSVANNVNLGPTYNYDRLSQDWQEISIPLSDFAGGGFEFDGVKVPFAIVFFNVLTDLTADIDAVRWEN